MATTINRMVFVGFICAQGAQSARTQSKQPGHILGAAHPTLHLKLFPQVNAAHFVVGEDFVGFAAG